jgi:hypothetical protein
MGPWREQRPGARAVRTVAFLLSALALLGLVSVTSSGFVAAALAPPIHTSHLFAQNGSGGSDPPESSTSGGLCPSGGPVILGVNWNCVAVLDLTELVLILVGIGIVAYVFKGSDRAELPGDAAEVPITAADWESYRKARELGVAYDPEESQDRGDER